MVLRGYDRRAVDAFLNRVMTETVTAEDVRGVTFRAALRCYDGEAVDAYLDELAAACG